MFDVNRPVRNLKSVSLQFCRALQFCHKAKIKISSLNFVECSIDGKMILKLVDAGDTQPTDDEYSEKTNILHLKGLLEQCKVSTGKLSVSDSRLFQEMTSLMDGETSMLTVVKSAFHLTEKETLDIILECFKDYESSTDCKDRRMRCKEKRPPEDKYVTFKVLLNDCKSTILKSTCEKKDWRNEIKELVKYNEANFNSKPTDSIFSLHQTIRDMVIMKSSVI